MSVGALDCPVSLVISGEWTPEQVWYEYLTQSRLAYDGVDPAAQLFLARADADSFNDPIVLPFFRKPIYDWENWNTEQPGMRDDDRIAFVILHSLQR